MSDKPISRGGGNGIWPFKWGSVKDNKKPADTTDGKENKSEAKSLSDRTAEASKEKTTSRTGTAQSKKLQEKQASNRRSTGLGERRVSQAVKKHVSDGDIPSGEPLHGRKLGEMKLTYIDYDILHIGVIDLEGLLDSKTSKKEVPLDPDQTAKAFKKEFDDLSPAALYIKYKDLVALENAGGIEVFNNIIEHFDKLAHDQKNDPKQREFYENARDRYVNRRMLIKMRKGDLEFRCTRKVKDFKPMPAKILDKKALDKIEYLTSKLIVETNKMIWEKRGYCSHSEDKFSDIFSEKLFQEYSAKPTTADRMGWYKAENGQELPVCELCHKDLNRSDYVLKDKNGKTIELTPESYPHFSPEDEEAFISQARLEGKSDAEIRKMIEFKTKHEIPELQEKWKKERVDVFLKFCGYDENADYGSQEKKMTAKNAAEEKLFKLSQCMCQEMGNGYLLVSGDDPHSPEHIGQSSFLIPPSGGALNSRFELIQSESGDIALKYIENIEGINVMMGPEEGRVNFTNSSISFYNKEVGVILNTNNEWEEYKDGKIGFNLYRA